MSAIGQILGLVEAKVADLLAGFTSSEDEQNQRLSVLEDKVKALESARTPAAKATPSKTAAAAKTAQAKGTAHS